MPERQERESRAKEGSRQILMEVTEKHQQYWEKSQFLQGQFHEITKTQLTITLGFLMP